jgi:hypothetical protein
MVESGLGGSKSYSWDSDRRSWWVFKFDVVISRECSTYNAVPCVWGGSKGAMPPKMPNDQKGQQKTDHVSMHSKSLIDQAYISNAQPESSTTRRL